MPQSDPRTLVAPLLEELQGRLQGHQEQYKSLCANIHQTLGDSQSRIQDTFLSLQSDDFLWVRQALRATKNCISRLQVFDSWNTEIAAQAICFSLQLDVIELQEQLSAQRQVALKYYQDADPDQRFAGSIHLLRVSTVTLTLYAEMLAELRKLFPREPL